MNIDVVPSIANDIARGVINCPTALGFATIVYLAVDNRGRFGCFSRHSRICSLFPFGFPSFILHFIFSVVFPHLSLA